MEIASAPSRRWIISVVLVLATVALVLFAARFGGFTPASFILVKWTDADCRLYTICQTEQNELVEIPEFGLIVNRTQCPGTCKAAGSKEGSASCYVSKGTVPDPKWGTHHYTGIRGYERYCVLDEELQ